MLLESGSKNLRSSTEVGSLPADLVDSDSIQAFQCDFSGLLPRYHRCLMVRCLRKENHQLLRKVCTMPFSAWNPWLYGDKRIKLDLSVGFVPSTPQIPSCLLVQSSKKRTPRQAEKSPRHNRPSHKTHELLAGSGLS